MFTKNVVGFWGIGLQTLTRLCPRTHYGTTPDPHSSNKRVLTSFTSNGSALCNVVIILDGLQQQEQQQYCCVTRTHQEMR